MTDTVKGDEIEGLRREPLLKDGDVSDRLKQFRLRWQESGDLTYLGKALTDAVVEIDSLREERDALDGYRRGQSEAVERMKERHRNTLAAAEARALLAESKLAEAKRALRPFAAFEETLRSWHFGKYSTPWSELKQEWPRHKPVLRRTRPDGEAMEIVREVRREDFERAAATLSNLETQETDARARSLANTKGSEDDR